MIENHLLFHIVLYGLFCYVTDAMTLFTAIYFAIWTVYLGHSRHWCSEWLHRNAHPSLELMMMRCEVVGSTCVPLNLTQSNSTGAICRDCILMQGVNIPWMGQQVIHTHPLLGASQHSSTGMFLWGRRKLGKPEETHKENIQRFSQTRTWVQDRIRDPGASHHLL